MADFPYLSAIHRKPQKQCFWGFFVLGLLRSAGQRLPTDFQHLLAHLKAKLPDVLAVYVFGSQASGHATAQSHLDMAVLIPGTLDPIALWSLSGEVSDIANLPVDWLDLRSASTVMQYQIITKDQHRIDVDPSRGARSA
ncbi:type VII toxin-antitoxin system MntA family adenylyltransferase antitoxin [Pseudomonas floridensis]|uniref:type VII toxin-antitoxin system MntA family adenylyltransferase antitoxin n=1 Tax=Pseudomonas floridensis TaxID=1958950 RepID=UPI00244965A5|nr:nucleotidyltransferase domain-containing protein [Pseudomonas floridensis]